MQNTAKHPNKHGVKDNITVLGESAQPLGTQGFMFGRMFPKADSFPMVLRLSTCALLGDRMTANPEVSRGDSKIPAGYTYFGQFVDHDISMDTTKQEVVVGNAGSPVVYAHLEETRYP